MIEHISQLCHLCEFELNSPDKSIRINSLSTALRYLSVSGRTVPHWASGYLTVSRRIATPK